MPSGFQVDAFQNNAFQVGFIFIAPTYTLGSPQFATPALAVALSANAYWTGSPQFATPVLAAQTITLHANAYVVGSPTFGAPIMRQVHNFAVAPYWTQRPQFGTPAIVRNLVLLANASATGSPDFGAPRLAFNAQLTADPYWVGDPTYGDPPPVLLITYALRVNAYWTGSPSFGFPRFTQDVRPPTFPPSFYTQAQEASDFLRQYLDHLLASIPSGTTDEINKVRGEIASLRARADQAVRSPGLGAELEQINLDANLAGATYRGIEATRVFVMSAATSNSLITQMLLRPILVMTLALQSKIISRMRFKTKEQVHNMILHVRDMFDQAQQLAVDDIDAIVYQTITALGGALINHLGSIELQLPRFVGYSTQVPMPSLYLANRIYQDASRYEEIEDENDIIHPAFCPTTIRVLSNVGRPNRL